MNTFILKNIKRIESLCFYPIYYYENEKLLYSPEQPHENIPLFCDPALFSIVYHALGISEDTANSDVFYYTQKYTDGSVILIGPCSHLATHKDIQKQYCLAHHIRGKFTFPIARASKKQVMNIIGLLDDLFSSCQIQPLSPYVSSGTAVLVSEDNSAEVDSDSENIYAYQQHIDYDSELNLTHIPYTIELKLIHALQMGDAESLNHALVEMSQYSPGNYAFSSFKAIEYGAIMMISTFTRAVIDAGVLPNDAYALSDHLATEVSRASSLQQCGKIYAKIFSSYLHLVRKKNAEDENSPYIKKCKSYIMHHLNQPLSPELLANHLHISQDYLLHLFSEQEGITLMEYIRKKRIEAAANMLKYSDFHIQRIAEYYQFKTQTHFGTVFKRYMGMTPTAYRKTYKPKEF